ncbi:glycosyltransferase family 4 protein [Litoribacter ruber]|nr:glycosyltransferase family 4 protein [Litoribacter ruber]
MKIILSHPTGNANVRAAANALADAGHLAEFRTSIASFPGGLLDKIGHICSFPDISRRQFSPQLKSVTHTWPWKEIARILASKAGVSSLLRHEQGAFCVDKVYKSFDLHVASIIKHARADAMYCYEDGAENSFYEAKKLKLTCLYDLPIGYWRAGRKIFESIRLQYPEWATTLSGLKDSEAKLLRKDEELKMADLILVASKFTAGTLKEFPGKLAPVKVIPYGFPAVVENREYSNGSRGPLKVLFVGSLSQRKGIANLLEAVDGLEKHVTLTIVGKKVSEDCHPLNSALAKHTWIPSLSHPEILFLMKAHDVLAFPSLFEGFGLVITEAMSQGTPVITTDRTAGPDLIEDGNNGWLIDAGSTEALKIAIEGLIGKPKKILEAGKAALETARRRPWQVYGQELVDELAKHHLRNISK